MRNKILSIGIFIILQISASAQVSKQISLHCGTHNSEAMKMFNSANWGMQTNRLEDAKQIYLKVVEIDSTFCDAWDNLSVCCRKLGQYDEAFYASMYSIMIDSVNVAAWMNCGYSSFLGGNTEISLMSFDNLQRIIPNNPEGYYGKSFVLYSIDSIASAKENIMKAKGLYKRISPEVRMLEAFIEFKSENYLDAQHILTDIYPKMRNNPEVNYNLSKCYQINEGNEKKSNKYKNRAIRFGYIIESE